MAEAISSPCCLATPTDYFTLMKPRVMSLVIFTALIGMVLAPGGGHPVLMGISLFAIAAGAGAAGALNQWYDRDIDAIMERTKKRPIPSGRVHPDEALSFGIIVAALSVLVLSFTGGFTAAALLAFTIFFYAVIYTIWLKRITPQNIVIGGAAGAFPPVIGWLAAGGAVWSEAWLLFLIIFIWTPPHFWSLAIARNDDYIRAAVPMLPVTHGVVATRRQIIGYSAVVAILGVMPYFVGMAGGFYAVLAALLGARFFMLAVALNHAPDNDTARMMALFRFSIIYLFAIFFMLGVNGWVK